MCENCDKGNGGNDSILIEIIFQAHDLADQCPLDRQEIEEELDKALELKEVGFVSGGGAGLGHVNIDVEIEDEKQLKTAIRLIRRVLKKLKVPNSTVLHICGRTEDYLPVYE